TEAQIHAALADGFEGVALDPRDLIGDNREAVVARAIADGSAILARGRSVLIYTALGPATDLGAAVEGQRHAIGRGLGRILAALVTRETLTRAVVAGGDTSSHALHELETLALTTRMPLSASPGSPLCVAHSDSAAFQGLEIAFKGGQVGDDHYLSRIRDGFPAT
ncbi:nucleotide-binding domain containing protein, partial [Lichenihabitans sp. Uapishka_5]|uniref:nucleotide-binding domain containing protein n=1 Tax=Lichenihabitans sp. Uapishka_5 TaxID=3037302 RepID=UPI0029E80D00